MDTLSTSAEELSKSGSWPKSYSVSSQGASPMHAPQKTDDDDVKPIESAPQEEAITAPVVEEAIAASVVEEAITQVTENGQVETKAEEVAIDIKPEEEAAVAVTAETTPKEAQEQVVEAPAEVSPEETSQPQEIVEPQARAAYKQTPTRQFFANWVALADPNHDDTSSIHSTETGSETVFIPKLQVEGKTAAVSTLACLP